MTLSLYEVENAVRQAKETIDNADHEVGKMVRIVLGRLRKAKVDPYYVAMLKRELEDFDARKKEWKVKP